MNNIISLYNSNDIKIDINEVIRYMGCKKTDVPDNILSLAKESAQKIESIAKGKACYIKVPITLSDGNIIDFSVMKVQSKSLYKNLYGCTKAFIFAATVGIDVERAISYAQRFSPSEALALDASGSACIESFCDNLNDFLFKEVNNDGQFLRPRFSAGYGDFDISYQSNISSILDIQRKIGVTVTDSLLLVPTKSVTAIIGICDNKCPQKKSKCERCGALNCPYME